MVYVDDARIRKLGGAHYSHMAADSLEELHVFAALLGLRRSWFHAHSKHPHYDVNDTERETAIAAGAQAVTPRELVAIAVCAKRNG